MHLDVIKRKKKTEKEKKKKKEGKIQNPLHNRTYDARLWMVSIPVNSFWKDSRSLSFRRCRSNRFRVDYESIRRSQQTQHDMNTNQHAFRTIIKNSLRLRIHTHTHKSTEIQTTQDRTKKKRARKHRQEGR